MKRQRCRRVQFAASGTQVAAIGTRFVCVACSLRIVQLDDSGTELVAVGAHPDEFMAALDTVCVKRGLGFGERYVEWFACSHDICRC